MIRFRHILLAGLALVAGVSCQEDGGEPAFQTTPYTFPVISNFRSVPADPANPVTVEGVELGRKLFFDPILSLDSSLACAGCHIPENGFSDPRKFSMGVDGLFGTRQSMALANLAWSSQFFWDGRANSLREQALLPVPNEVEMHLPWEVAVPRLQSHPEYVALFEKAFNTKTVTKENVTAAIEQFEKTLISYNSPYDKYIRGEANLTLSEQRGLVIFNTEKGDCFHCHTTPELFVHPTKIFSNNGLDEAATPNDFADIGFGETTGKPLDNGKFKIPSLRNLAFTAPYMHDGRFQTLDEVIESYNQGPKLSPSLDSILIVKAQYRLDNYGHWGLNLTSQEKEDLKNFLLSLSDTTFLNGPH